MYVSRGGRRNDAIITRRGVRRPESVPKIRNLRGNNYEIFDFFFIASAGKNLKHFKENHPADVFENARNERFRTERTETHRNGRRPGNDYGNRTRYDFIRHDGDFHIALIITIIYISDGR